MIKMNIDEMLQELVDSIKIKYNINTEQSYLNMCMISTLLD